MKKILLIVLILVLVVNAVVFTACDLFSPQIDYSYVLSGKFNNWKVSTISNDSSKLDPDYELTKISADDSRISSIRSQVSAAEEIYLGTHSFISAIGGATVSYVLSPNGQQITVSEQLCLSIAQTYYKQVEGGGVWKTTWLTGNGETIVKSLTSYTLYCPPHSETPTYQGSGTWNDSPIVLKDGYYYIVLAKFSDGSYGIGAIDTGIVDDGYRYVITGQFNGWGVPKDANDSSKIDEKYLMKLVAPQDQRLSSIENYLTNVKSVHVVEHTVTDTSAGWELEYALTDGAEVTKFDGNQTIKVIKTQLMECNGVSAWEQNWIPDSGNTIVRSVTPSTLYVPPHAEAPIYENSGAWNDHPVILETGDYLIVFVQYKDGSFGLGAISLTNPVEKEPFIADPITPAPTPETNYGEYSYVITGSFNGWGVSFGDENRTQLDARYKMTSISDSDYRVESIKDQLQNAKSIYIVEHTVTDTGAGWTFGYALTKGAPITTFDGNQAIKVIKTRYSEVDGIGAWEQHWFPDSGNTTVKSLTPYTLYCPPHSEAPIYENSGMWNENPAILAAGNYYVVFVEFADGTFGLGAIIV